MIWYCHKVFIPFVSNFRFSLLQFISGNKIFVFFLQKSGYETKVSRLKNVEPQIDLYNTQFIYIVLTIYIM